MPSGKGRGGGRGRDSERALGIRKASTGAGTRLLWTGSGEAAGPADSPRAVSQRVRSRQWQRQWTHTSRHNRQPKSGLVFRGRRLSIRASGYPHKPEEFLNLGLGLRAEKELVTIYEPTSLTQDDVGAVCCNSKGTIAALSPRPLFAEIAAATRQHD